MTKYFYQSSYNKLNLFYSFYNSERSLLLLDILVRPSPYNFNCAYSSLINIATLYPLSLYKYFIIKN